MIPFEEATTTARTKSSTPIRELGLTIAGTVLEPIIAQFEKERLRAGILKLRPRYYLSTEWGVPEATIAIAIPFYLVRPELTLIHAEHACHVEGSGPKEILRYLRHEMGHVVNYAYRLHERKDWTERFGPMARPYEEEYRPRPFSREFVHHLPGWYAQKHPDEDWAETFAVWMTPDLDWRKEYAKWPGALRKLEYCDRTMIEIRSRDPVITSAELDGDVGTLSMSLEQFYKDYEGRPAERVAGLDRMLVSIFSESQEIGIRLAVSDLLRRLERDLPGSVYHWTGHMPERTLGLLAQMAERADALALTFRVEREQELTIAVTSLVTALAMHWLQSGRYET
ncbi:putative zinc-binding metallopeptidase [Pendulispora brunnea]|uniref:Zinc-binding metallopeptidase n=1 Tax=Pendulispora brunnea TaxID=2905690 RepID=A0ABZ2K3T1_9BACT